MQNNQAQRRPNNQSDLSKPDIANKPRLAIVDDSPTVRLNTQHRFEQLGWTVQAFSNDFGVALEIMKFAPDAILLDADMPRLNGEGLCKVLRNPACLPNTAIFYFSSLPPEQLADLAARTNAHGYFQKSSNLGILNQTLQRSITPTSRPTLAHQHRSP